MLIQISLEDGLPIYRQIVNQIKYLIASGQLCAEEELPAIRSLAQQLTVTPNTIVKAYGELETEGLIYKRRGAGTFVANTSCPLTLKEQRRILSERIDTLLAEASRLNFSLGDLQVMLTKQHDQMIRQQSDSAADSRPGKRHGNQHR